MKTWTDYKKTMSDYASLFDLAREGRIQPSDLQGMSLEVINLKNEKGYSALMLAAYYGQYESCQLLIDAGADVNSHDSAGSTILMGVAFKGHQDIFDLLIQSGADIDVLNFKKQSALDFALLFGRESIVASIQKIKRQQYSLTFTDRIRSWSKLLFNTNQQL